MPHQSSDFEGASMSETDQAVPDSGDRGRARAAIGLCLVLAIGLAGIWLAGWTRSNYANPERFYQHDLPPAERTPAISERVVLVLIDGLRDDVARQLPQMSALARRPDSAFRRSVTGVPSLSRPGAIAVLCGSGPEQSGFPLNESGGVVGVECLFDTVADAGRTSAIGGVGEGFEARFHPPRTRVFARHRSDDVSAYVPDDPESYQLAKEALGTDASFVYLYFPDVDEESHLSGPFSPQAQDAAKTVDGFIGAIAASMDLSKQTLIVTSDHGHRDKGGHGGYEYASRRSPLLMVGKGIAGGSTGDVSQTDIAPTVAALLGVARPRHAEGMPLVGGLDVDAETAAAIRSAHEAALARKLQADLAALEGRPVSPGEVGILRKLVDEAGWARGVREAFGRVPGAIAIAAILAVSMAISGGFRREDLLGGAVAAGVFAFVIWATGWRLTISQFNVSSDEGRLTVSLIAASAVAVLVGSLLAAGVARSSGRARATFGRHVVAATSAAQGFAGILLVWMFVYYGLKYSWRLPDLRPGLATFWAMYAMGFSALAAAVLWGVSGLARRMVRKGAGSEEEGKSEAGATASGAPEGLGGTDTDASGVTRESNR